MHTTKRRPRKSFYLDILSKAAARQVEKDWNDRWCGYVEKEPTTGQLWITVNNHKGYIRLHCPFDWLYERGE